MNSYNADERLSAAREGREPLLLPEFSCHHLRHTFATRLCEVESNLKVIQSIMGHKNIETTMDIYAEATDRKKEETFENLAAKLDELFYEVRKTDLIEITREGRVKELSFFHTTFIFINGVV